MSHLAVSNIAWSQEHDRQMYHVMAELGYEGLEIAPGRIMGKKPYKETEAARKWAEELRQEYHLVIPSMQSIWYGREENLFRSAEEREILLQYSEAAMRFAEAVSCRNLVFGCPRNRNIERLIEISEENVQTIAFEFFEKLGIAAKANRVVVGMEANPVIYHTNFLNTTEETVAWIRRCKAPGLGLNLDLGAMFYNGESVERIREWLPLVSHVHISEAGLLPIQKRPEHRRLFEILYEEHYPYFVSIEMGCCEEIGTVVEVMKYIREVSISAEHKYSVSGTK